MTEDDCFQLYPNDDDGTYYYAGVWPSGGGTFQMSLFEDASCATPKTDTSFSSVYEDQYYYNSYWSQLDDDEYVYGQTNRRRRLDEDKDDVCNGDDDRRRLGDNGDNNGYMDCQAWASAREPSLEALNSVFETYKYCTPCIGEDKRIYFIDISLMFGKKGISLTSLLLFFTFDSIQTIRHIRMDISSETTALTRTISLTSVGSSSRMILILAPANVC